jgi:hypothetical protein
MDSTAALGARQVCDELQRRFPEIMARHKDPVASVTTVLSRLADYGEARSFSNASGRRVWEWVADRQGASKGDVTRAPNHFEPDKKKQ